MAFYVSQFDVLTMAQRRFGVRGFGGVLVSRGRSWRAGGAGEAGTTVALALRLVSCLFGVSLFCEINFETGEIGMLC